MIIRRDKNGYVDFEAPIALSEEQKKDFTDFMGSLFKDVSFEEVHEPEINRQRGYVDLRSWTVDDYVAVLGPESIDELEKKINRSEMAIRMKRAWIFPAFYEWLKKNGHAMNVANQRDLARQFVEELHKNGVVK